MMAQQMMKNVLAPEPQRHVVGDPEQHLAAARLVAMEAGIGRLADKRAGDIEIIAIFVGPRPDHRIVIGHRIGFGGYDLRPELRSPGS